MLRLRSQQWAAKYPMGTRTMHMEILRTRELPTQSLMQSPTESSERIVHEEVRWCTLPPDTCAEISSGRISASRWTGFAHETRDEVSNINPDVHVLGVALRAMDVMIFTGRELVHDGRLQPGMMWVNEPGAVIKGIFRGGYDILHLHIPSAAIFECIEAGCGLSEGGAGLLARRPPVLDPVIEKLAHAFIRADELGGGFGRRYADGIGLAIVTRLLGKSTDGISAPAANRVSELPKWRLKRAVDYMAAHLAEPICLADIAASTGLTRMHFAAGFRAATGLRPHEYLLRRRIERAQELLASSRLPLVQIAFEVGFKTQAHFTTVFSKFVGVTPNAWRRQNNVDLGPVVTPQHGREMCRASQIA
jgi:AraC family transcriptional regulator